jgi:hypothetical protein
MVQFQKFPEERSLNSVMMKQTSKHLVQWIVDVIVGLGDSNYFSKVNLKLQLIF